MPYISKARRREIEDGVPPIAPGELNYVITRAVHLALGKTPGYREYNAAIGALRVVANAVDGCRENASFPNSIPLTRTILVVVREYLATGSDRLRDEVIGVLECAKLELYRRHIAPYEDVKIKENGDVP